VLYDVNLHDKRVAAAVLAAVVWEKGARWLWEGPPILLLLVKGPSTACDAGKVCQGVRAVLLNTSSFLRLFWLLSRRAWC